MGFSRPDFVLFTDTTYDAMVQRVRDDLDATGPTSSMDEARAERADDFSHGPDAGSQDTETGGGGVTPHERRQQVLAALTDRDGNPKPWLAAEEIGYSPFCDGLSVRQIAAALSWMRQRGFVMHDGVEWKLTRLGLALTKEGL